MQLLTPLLVLVYISALAYGALNEQTIEETPGNLTDKEVAIDFVATKVVEPSPPCDPSKTVCGAVKGPRTIITITAGQTITNSEISVAAAGGSPTAKITVKKASASPPPSASSKQSESIGQLNTTSEDKVATNQSFIIPFIVETLTPDTIVHDDKKQTVVILNGVLGDQTVSIDFTDEKPDGATTYTLKIAPKTETTEGTSSAIMKKLCSFTPLLGLTILLLNF